MARSLDLHDRSTCSGKKKNHSRSSLDLGNNGDLRVRFADQVQTGFTDDEKSNRKYGKLGTPDDVIYSEKCDSPLFKKHPPYHHPIQESTTRIPNLGVSVHKVAYELALEDARASGAYIKKKGKKKNRIQSERSIGTVFSYFPPLNVKRRPLSEGTQPEAALNLGLTQNQGRKVARKNYMKHIFGNINIGDYYPGGKKYRPF